MWKERISRILDIKDRRYSIFIELDLLASFSLGLEPNTAVKALLRANKKRSDLRNIYIYIFIVFALCVCRGEHNEVE
jgi:hypothetical protein